MHLVGHALSALPFLAVGMPHAALGALAPDLTWIGNELRYRWSHERPWSRWIATLPARRIVPYRIAHSLFVPLTLSLLGAHELALGWALHLLLDLPTHRGIMRQQPLYPFTWRWPWTFPN
jgi:hypothetical protein